MIIIPWIWPRLHGERGRPSIKPAINTTTNSLFSPLPSATPLSNSPLVPLLPLGSPHHPITTFPFLPNHLILMKYHQKQISKFQIHTISLFPKLCCTINKHKPVPQISIKYPSKNSNIHSTNPLCPYRDVGGNCVGCLAKVSCHLPGKVFSLILDNGSVTKTIFGESLRTSNSTNTINNWYYNKLQWWYMSNDILPYVEWDTSAMSIDTPRSVLCQLTYHKVRMTPPAISSITQLTPHLYIFNN